MTLIAVDKVVSLSPFWAIFGSKGGDIFIFEGLVYADGHIALDPNPYQGTWKHVLKLSSGLRCIDYHLERDTASPDEAEFHVLARTGVVNIDMVVDCLMLMIEEHMVGEKYHAKG